MGDNGTVSSEDKMLPEQLMLGLRLTVGEDQVPISTLYLVIYLSNYLVIYLFIYVCPGGEAAAAEQTGAWQLPRAGASESSGGGAVLPGPALHSHAR